ncbi:hypothetical protein V6N11_071675 [Hibiscus sabdariffa]|uniref:Uncharacterized protein n=2 Tax=Hibiscus sabdariffa TaxID=183260 RepID=A0ABR1Z9L0_9ROSI
MGEGFSSGGYWIGDGGACIWGGVGDGVSMVDGGAVMVREWGGGDGEGMGSARVLVPAIAVGVVAGRSVGAADKDPGCPALFGL